jgi:hypothetical protein
MQVLQYPFFFEIGMVNMSVWKEEELFNILAIISTLTEDFEWFHTRI